MNEIWQAALAERGDKAFELFCDSKGLVFDSNDDIERELVGYGDVRLKPEKPNPADFGLEGIEK